MDFDTLPLGQRFAFWDDATHYAKVLHVAQNHPQADDANPGSADKPLRSINAAAKILQPGQKVIIHRGTYRECVRPPRGGTAPDQMIAYEAAPDERITIKASQLWTPQPRPSAGYQLRGGATVWMADLPEEYFTAGYNPFLLRNVYAYMSEYGNVTEPAWLARALSRRAMVFLDGQPLRQVFRFRELQNAPGVFWADDDGLRLHFRLPGDADPNGRTLEVTAREQCFAPREMGLGYIRVSGLAFEHAADGPPVPQRAALSTTRGHHWIIENNRVEWTNACGMDIGCQTWDATIPDVIGHHIVRGNRIRHCGICGLAGAHGVHHTLIENNIIEDTGHRDLERTWEAGAIKFHLARNCLIRRNVIRRCWRCAGVWLDCDNVNNRITSNVFADIETRTGAVYSEMNFAVNLVDHNIFWDVRSADPAGELWATVGAAVRADCNEKLVVAHNFFGRVQAFAVSYNQKQAARPMAGRTGLSRANVTVNNVFYQCPRRLNLGRREENRSDGNCYDEAGDSCSFAIELPAPGCLQNLAGWQEFFGLDTHSTQGKMEATFDAQTSRLQWRCDAPLPPPQPTGLPGENALAPSVGPASLTPNRS
jgi:hypothetical protein